MKAMYQMKRRPGIDWRLPIPPLQSYQVGKEIACVVCNSRNVVD